MQSTLFIGTAMVAVLAFTAATRAETLHFDVLRGGNSIGTHVIAIDHQGPATSVDIATNVAVKVAFVTAYRFTHEGHERWQGDSLAALSSVTNDDGKKHELSVKAANGVFAVHADGRDAEVMPRGLGSLWRASLVAGGPLLNTLDGSLMTVDIRDAGAETVETAKGPVPARHLTIRGDLVRDVWYDPDGLLVKLTMTGSDGSAVEYRRR